ncbi:unnamed protein product, partial [Anisakis simplex]|uniref:Uncharacterized protein n=1 Tax=Anisakis simplex TaxID=6269 RepID=A0A0M3KDB8_ANISI
MDWNKSRSPKNLSAGVHSSGARKQSITAQLTRSARRFSAAVAPQFTKLDAFPLLQKYRSLHLRICDISQ